MRAVPGSAVHLAIASEGDLRSPAYAQAGLRIPAQSTNGDSRPRRSAEEGSTAR
jgi:hypothetical protein